MSSLPIVAVFAALQIGNPQSVELQVREAILQLQCLDRENQFGKFEKLDKRAIPYLLNAIPKIETGLAIKIVGKKLEDWNVAARFRPLIETYARSYPEESFHPARDLIQRGGYHAVVDLLQSLDHPNENVRDQVASHLAQLCRDQDGARDPRLDQTMVKLAKSPSVRMRRTAIFGLSRSSDEIAWFVCAEMIYDADYEIRQDMRKAFMYQALEESEVGVYMDRQWMPFEMTHEQLTRKVRAALKKENPLRRAAAVASLFNGSSPAFAHLDDPDPRVARAAALSVMLKPVLAKLAPLAESAHVHTRWQVATCLGRSFDPKALPVLEKLAEDPNQNVRTAAKKSIRAITVFPKLTGRGGREN